MFFIPPWCLLWNMFHLYLSENQWNIPSMSKLPGAPEEKLELGASSPGGPMGLVIPHQSGPLSNIAEAHNFLLFFYLFFNLEQSFSPVPFLLTVVTLFLPQCGLPLFLLLVFQESRAAARSGIHFFIFFCQCSLLLNNLKTTSANWEGFMPNVPCHICNFLLLRYFAQWVHI